MDGFHFNQRQAPIHEPDLSENRVLQPQIFSRHPCQMNPTRVTGGGADTVDRLFGGSHQDRPCYALSAGHPSSYGYGSLGDSGIQYMVTFPDTSRYRWPDHPLWGVFRRELSGDLVLNIFKNNSTP